MTEFDEKFKFREYDEYDLGADAIIDKFALDVAAEEQPHLMQKWLELLTQAQAEAAKLKEQLNNKEAELILIVKKEGIQGISKPTEATTKAWVHTHHEYVKLLEKKRKADNNVNYLQNARAVLEHKKAMIKVEADLWITGYYARPSVSSETKKVMETEQKKDHANKLKKSLKKRHLRREENE